MDKELIILNDMKDVIDLLIKHYYEDDVRENLESVLTSLRNRYLFVTTGKELKEWQKNNIMI